MSLVKHANAEFLSGLLSFLKSSPTPFHATAVMVRALQAAGFNELKESDSWSLQAGQGYYCSRNGSSLIAFVYGEQPLLEAGLHMMGAHTDSPCLKVKPHPEMVKSGYFQLGVEVYGGVLLNPWFDRDLSLAGRVSYRSESGALGSVLIDFERAIATIPSLAIHLDREVNNSRSVNPQKDIPPVLMQVQSGQKPDFRSLLKTQVLVQYPQLDIADVLDYELSFYDAQAPAVIGFQDDFIASARLDNLLSCYIGLEALLNSDRKHSSLLICNDHEEVGSASTCGAQGPMLADFLQRLLPNAEERIRVIDRSVMISIDNAHGIHPNFSDRHDSSHGPELNKGPVIKLNANQRYATNDETSALFRQLCEDVKVPVQAFVIRTDLACGSTIGPIAASKIGVPTVDVGLPTFGMHSIRELAGSHDPHYLYRVLCHFVDTRIKRV